MKNQTNTTIKYSNNRHTNLNLNQFYKRFLLKAVSMIAIPILTVSMIPSFALAEDSTDNELIDTQTVSQIVNDGITSASTHIISVNLSTITMEDPYQSVNLNESDLIPEPTNDVTVYNIEAKSVQYEASPSNAESENISQIEAAESTSTYRYANLVHLTDSERKLVYDIVANEVGSCSYRDKLLVAQAFYDGLVYNKCSPQKLAKGQYDAIRKGFDAFKQECIKCGVTYYEDIIKAVEEVFDKNNMPSNEFVLYFYNPKICKSSWHEKQKFVEDTGAHRYFALPDNLLP
mgnify:CR=1 FL=1